MKAAPSCQSLDSLQRFARSLNESGEWSPLPADEVGRVAGSAWQCHIEGRNGFAGDTFVQVPTPTFDNLAASADASYLYWLLKRNHWGREFCIANEWRKHLPDGEWSRPKFTAARQFLVDNGFVVMIRPAIKGVGPALFRFADQFGPDGVQGGGRGRGV
ncbi:hypothetical protein [Erythrobacter sp. HI0063]|uniref:hypothetical protein n=1 Tax=Erythrobacter sp. HI0063 TaxID=1822240 RepID=UPI001F4083C9|nr:hypothetical protein [Erythrobacter sp. HI0063]